MDELQVLRTQVGEMAAEVERLQSVIDEANALKIEIRQLTARAEAAEAQLKVAQEQLPVGIVDTVGGYPDDSEHKIKWLVKHKAIHSGDKLYADPVPAQQSPEITDHEGRPMTYWGGKSVRQSPAAKWIKNHAKHPDTCDQVTSLYRKPCSCGLVEILECKQSPPVAVPGDKQDSESPGNIGNEIHNIATALAYSGRESIADELGAIAVRLWALGQSPRITDPTELEMHRADYRAIKSAGFESPGELLAAYKHLLLSNRVTEQDVTWYAHSANITPPNADDVYLVEYSLPGLHGETNTAKAVIHYHPSHGWRSKVTPMFVGNTAKDSAYIVKNMIGFRTVFGDCEKITEQDAREIIKEYLAWFWSDSSNNAHGNGIIEFFKSEEGRALLNKLNGDQNAQ